MNWRQLIFSLDNILLKIFISFSNQIEFPFKILSANSNQDLVGVIGEKLIDNGTPSRI